MTFHQGILFSIFFFSLPVSQKCLFELLFARDIQTYTKETLKPPLLSAPSHPSAKEKAFQLLTSLQQMLEVHSQLQYKVTKFRVAIQSLQRASFEIRQHAEQEKAHTATRRVKQ